MVAEKGQAMPKKRQRYRCGVELFDIMSIHP
jgi:hypothetical protein